MADAPPKPETQCPRCMARVRIHPITGRIPDHPERGERGEQKCSWSGDYRPGYAAPKPIRKPRRTQ